jgi:hypothetical protein
MFKQGSGEYNVSFESVPYSRGGKFKRHTSTLHSTQKWEIVDGVNEYYISTSSSSRSGACPSVKVPMFYTEVGKTAYNQGILNQISELQKKLLK